MLKQNGHLQNQLPLRFMGGGTISGNRANWGRSDRRNWFVGAQGEDNKCGIPSGYLAGGSWCLPQKAGGMASFTTIVGDGEVAGGGALGLNADAALTGSGDITQAIGQLVISMVANLTGDGTIANADFRGYLNAVANLSGSGDLTGPLAALAWAQAAVSGGGDITNATPYATGELSADIRGYSDLTPEGIRDKVWNAILAQYPDAGTAGKALASASSGGVDYAALAAALLAAAQVEPIAANIKKVNDVTVQGTGATGNEWGPG